MLISFSVSAAVFLLILGVLSPQMSFPRMVQTASVRQGVQVFVPLAYTFFPEDVRDSVTKRLAWGGLDISAGEFLAVKLATATVIPVVGSLVLAALGYEIIWALLLAGVGYMAPEYWLQARVSRRQKEIRKSVLEFATLLATTLDAGGGDVYMALDLVGTRFKDELGKEVRRAAHDIASGKRRSDALQDMSARCGVEELDQLIRVILQAERYGTPIADAVRQHAGQVRLMRRYAAEKVANEASVKMVFPMLVFIVGPLLVMLIYPAAQQFKGILS